MKKRLLYIWGAGRWGELAYFYYKDDSTILGYIDSNPAKWGTTKNGVIIYPPDILNEKKAMVVIAVKENKSVVKLLKEVYGIKNIVYFGCYEKIENDFGQKKELLDENSLIVRFGGGLGNQMFQYALMRNYLLKNQNVYVDLDGYTRPRNGVFELTEVFPNLEIKVCDREQKLNLIERYESGKILNKFIIYNESKFELDKSLLNIQAGIVWGLHQNYYFASLIRNILLDDFKFNIEVDKKLKEQCERLENSKNIVSVHIRRGDYLSPRYYPVLGDICNEIYYNQAMKYMEEQLGNCQFYFFSDDMQWVKQHYSRENAVYIEASMFDSYENWYDMCMMSFCSHNIIANSTFSWWGAWLNKRNDKIVIAPKKWSKTYGFANICPPEWIRI